MIDPSFMAEALALAGRARPSPNPPVGAVVVRDGRIVGRGFHRLAGGPHAEIVALRQAGTRARGADLYVTLEPCNHHGRTPPCTDAILAAGIRRVFFGVRDPNPRVRGGGAARLRDAGVEAEEGLLGTECAERIAPFAKFARTGLPFVTVKIASSLDGRIAARTGKAKWISGPEARAAVQRMRAAHDAILVGAGTVRADDPRLTLRLPRGTFVSPPPVRIILARGPLPRRRRVLSGAGGETWVVRPTGVRRPVAPVAAGPRFLDLPADRDGFVPERRLLAALGRRGVTSVLVEGGGAVFTRFLQAGLADRIALFLAPRLLGGPAERGWFCMPGFANPSRGIPLELLRLEGYGEDVLWLGKPAG